MQIVINIDEEDYERLKEYKKAPFCSLTSRAYEAIANGTPLPKGHGRLIDVTNLMRGLYTDMQTIEETFTSSDVYKMIDEECPTVIEADEEVTDDSKS